MMSPDFKSRLFPLLPQIMYDFEPARLVDSRAPVEAWALSPAAVILDEKGIIESIDEMKRCLFVRPGDTNFFAVKCNPNIYVLRLMLSMGFGLDCASPTELYLALLANAKPSQIMYTANNLTANYLAYAVKLNCIINIDDVTGLDLLVEVLKNNKLKMPELICFRYNPGDRRSDGGSNFIIGEPVNQKYGLTHDQILPAYKRAKQLGAQEFGIHMMYASNCLDYQVLAANVTTQLDMADMIGTELGSPFKFINAGGGIGVNYRPGEKPVDLSKMGEIVNGAMADFEAKHGYLPQLWLESGRYVVAPHGALVGRIINVLQKYKMFIGVDFCDACDLHRANIYETAYHHINLLDVYGQPKTGDEIEVDVIGPLCENVRLAKARLLPVPRKNDFIVVEDAGGHGQAMASHYNGWGLSQTLVLHTDNSVSRIARAETIGDLIQTQLLCEKEVGKVSY
ncbi:diaminopimelate decarboxylase [Candidatus Falkowbacteria bacterium]|nr:diaminopimelate decarboxylase [Candidatus Falkowbacteria bacterium]